jgi:hypothetical protein
MGRPQTVRIVSLREARRQRAVAHVLHPSEQTMTPGGNPALRLRYRLDRWLSYLPDRIQLRGSRTVPHLLVRGVLDYIQMNCCYTDWTVRLYGLWDSRPVNVQDVARSIRSDHRLVGGVLSWLESEGLLVRRHHGRDRITVLSVDPEWIPVLDAEERRAVLKIWSR